VWEKQWGALDRYNLVKTEQYLANMQHVLNDESLKRKAHHFLPYLFKVNNTLHTLVHIKIPSSAVLMDINALLLLNLPHERIASI